MTEPDNAHPQRIVLIAAVGRNRVIGRQGGLAWRDPIDARHLRATTLGSPVIMGRKTWDSLPTAFRPLPGRRNVVVTRNAAWRAAGAEAVLTFDQALRHTHSDAQVFVLGGGELYTLALPHAHALVLTEVDADLDGDVHFPHFSRADFVVTSRVPHRSDQGVDFAFVTYERRAAG
jgi:dihydrofolate reductase